MSFERLQLAPALLRALRDTGYEVPTPIQTAAIPAALEGRDILGCAQTGTGKTAAFALPVLQRLDATAGDDPVIRALVLTPTRELAAQIGESFATYGKHLDLWHTTIFGGVNDKPQIAELKRGIDILVATPGRLLDLIQRKFVDLSRVETFVLDEADQMLDMGFLPDVKRIVKALPVKRQTLFFSATMPPAIRSLADALLNNPLPVAVTPVAKPADKIDQRLYYVDKDDKRQLLIDVLRDQAVRRALVFSRTKHGANRVAQVLERAGVKARAIHGNKSQNARNRALEELRSGEVSVLVATDLAARGLDIDGITHVINFDLPNVPETYVHRIGRTARAGASGIALSFCDGEERPFLADIEKLIGRRLELVEDHPYPMTGRPSASPSAPPPRTSARPSNGAGRRGGRRGGRGRSSSGARAS